MVQQGFKGKSGSVVQLKFSRVGLAPEDDGVNQPKSGRKLLIFSLGDG